MSRQVDWGWSGASGSFTVQIQRVNFTGAVTVGLLNPPTGITGAVNPTAATGDVAALAILVAPSVAPGTLPTRHPGNQQLVIVSIRIANLNQRGILLMGCDWPQPQHSI